MKSMYDHTVNLLKHEDDENILLGTQETPIPVDA